MIRARGSPFINSTRERSSSMLPKLARAKSVRAFQVSRYSLRAVPG